MSDRPNILAPDVRANPYPLYAELRRTPVRQVEPMGMWALSRYEDVTAALKDTQRFSSSAYTLQAQPDWLKHMPVAQSMIAMDPPDHTKLRALVAKAFGPAVQARMEPRIRAFADKLAEQVVQRGEVEFVEEFSMKMPTFVIGDLLGLDPSLHGRFKRWADDIMLLNGHPTPEQIPSIIQSTKDTDFYFTQVLEERRRAPQNDLISDLMKAEVDGRALTHEELMSFCFLLLVAGIESTSHLLTNIMLVLSDRPEVVERVRKDLSLVPRMVEEVLRFEPPVHVCHRLTKAPVEIGGATIPPGSIVLVLLGSALRDEKYCPNPDQFSLERDKPNPLAFGFSAHACIGAMLAKLEARIAMEALLPRISSVTRPSQTLNWVMALTTRGPTELKLRFQPA